MGKAWEALLGPHLPRFSLASPGPVAQQGSGSVCQINLGPVSSPGKQTKGRFNSELWCLYLTVCLEITDELCLERLSLEFLLEKEPP